jgi:hypothetical protein
MDLLLGIDPGTQGALCFLEPTTGTIEFIDTPNTNELWESLTHIEDRLRINIPRYIAIEDVHSLGGMSAKSNFQFGRNLGLIESLIHTCGCEDDVIYVQPKAWQKACGVEFKYTPGMTSEEKAKHRKLTVAADARILYPEAQIYGPKGGLKDGRSDALMIAHYLRLTVGDLHGNKTKA